MTVTQAMNLLPARWHIPLIRDTMATLQYVLTDVPDGEPTEIFITFDKGDVSVFTGTSPSEPDLTVMLKAEDFVAMVGHKVKIMDLIRAKKMTVKGDTPLARRLFVAAETI